jgi:hypothetical protein
MNARAPKPDLQEQLGRAINTSHLEHRAERDTAVVLVGAMGAAALHIHHGADRARVPVSTVLADPRHVADPQDALAAQLAVSLRHIREAGQLAEVPRAVRLFAEWMAYRGRFCAIEDSAILLPRLAQRALHEWLSDRCIACGGSGKLERSPTGSWLRPRGSMQRNATFRTCQACNGTRRQAISHTERRIALGMTRERYDAERWDAHCKAAMAWLVARFHRRLNRPTAVQLERGRRA